MKKTITAIGLIATQMFFAQNEDFLPKIVPPSPQAAELGKYGNVPVGMFTGSPNINLNIYTLQESGLSIPINITYNSNGVQVDGVAKQLGIDWNLIAGGVISRQINDLDDLQFPFTNINATNLCLYDSAEGANLANGTIDTEKDIFHFNFLGTSGKFYFEGNDIVQIEPSNIKIERLPAPNNAMPKFKIINIDGTEYYFGGVNAVEKSFNRSHCGGVTPPILYDTAWYLSKIKTNQGQEMLLNYEQENFQYIQSYHQTAISGGNYSSLPNAVLYPPCYNELRHDTSFLKEIIINDKKVNFNYQKIDPNSHESKQLISIDVFNNTLNIIKKFIFNYNSYGVLDSSGILNSYTDTNEKYIFLKEIKEVAPTTNESFTKYAFDYYSPEQLPPRHSFAKDIYGYYNGANNNSNVIYNNLVNQNPINNTDAVYNAFKNISSNRTPNYIYTKNGMLKSIYYPTKGKSELVYEPNSVSRDKTITPPIVQLADAVISESAGYNTIVYSQPFTVNSNISATLYAVAWRDCGADDPIHPPQVHVNVINADTGAIIKTLSTNETPANTTVILSPGINYKLKSRVSRPCLGANAFINAPAGSPYTVKVNDPVAGMRVSKTLNYDNNGNIETKKYFYGKLESLDTTSGVFATEDPQLGRNVDLFQSSKIYNYSTTIVTSKYTMNSNPKVNLSSLDGYMIMYPYVVESYGENFEKGGVLHNFSDNKETFPEYVCQDELFRGISFSNNFLAGREKLNKTFRKVNNNFITLSSEEFIYSINPVFNKTIDNYVGRLVKTTEEITTDSYGNTSTVTFKYYGINRYQLNSEFHYLSSKKNTIYDKNGQNPILTQTEYNFNNPLHFQLTSQKITYPDLSINQITYNYALEKSNQLMMGKNMVGVPLETTILKTENATTKTLSQTEKVYPVSQSEADIKTSGLIVPYEIKSTNLLGLNSIEVTYDQYDLKGNLLQYTSKDGIPTAIIWGYSGTQPIAKIEGVKISDITQSLIDTIVNFSNVDALEGTITSDQNLNDKLDIFRREVEALPRTNTQITTYTYDPLIGVTSITPPSGIREVYKYDSANRLENIKDINGKLLKEFKYNYKP